MKHFRSFMALACSLALLAGCVTANSAVDGGTAPGRASGGFLGLGEASDVSVQTPKAFAGVNQVVIGGFKVGFVESKAESAKAGGGLMGSGFGGKSSAKLKIENLDEATRQQIVDIAYQNFVSALKSNGIKVVERSTLMNNPDFASVKTYDLPVVQDNSGILSSYGVTKYYAPSEFGGKTPIFMGEIIGFTGGFGFSNPSTAAAKYAEASGIPVINVSYVLDFANTDKYGGSFRNTSSVNVGQGLSIVPGAILGITGGHMGTFSTSVGSIKTGQPLYSTETFGEITDTTSGAYKGVEIATNVVGLLGGVGSNISREYVVAADPSRYKAIAVKLSTDLNKTLVGEMVAKR